MKWKENVIQKASWNGTMLNQEAKEKIGQIIASKVKDGEIIYFGSGSTAQLATRAIGKRVKEEALNILAIPTSYEIEMLCHELNIPVTTLNYQKPDWGFDGADEVSPQKWLIKGRGGALFREKLLMASSPLTYILVDDSKFVNKIGEKFPVPVECVPESLHFVKEHLYNLGAISIELRLAKGKDGPIITEHGNFILDVKFSLASANLEKEIKGIPGVIESGLFTQYNIEIISN